MTSITMPQLGESVAEGTIGKWLKSAGERIELDEPLVEVITDKVTAEIPSPVAGVVEKIAVDEGETVPVGQEIAVVGEPGAAAAEPPSAASEQADETPEQAAGEAAGPASSTAAASTAATPSRRDWAEGDRGDGGAAREVEPGERRRASPLVRRLAREHNVNLVEVQGSGAGGRVTKDDIQAFIESRGAVPEAAEPSVTPAAAETAPVPAEPAPREGGTDEEYLPLSPMRKTIAEHMARSKQISPDAWGLVEVDVTALVKARQRLVVDWQRREGFELTFLPFFIKAVVESLREHPIVNSSWGDDRIILKKRINVGIAVAVEEGLVVPVIHDADQKSIAGLAHTVRDLASRARAGKLGLPDVRGGTFTVNNTGALGSIMSAPIINQPQAAIVTMEAIVKRPTVIDDAIAIRSIMNTCLTFDHRVLDGATALRFLQSVKRRLEAYDHSTAVY
jgi:2-oxoisovalerate dehydrogenase E2 component (dihydrolipoyl transacylase)